MWPFSKPKTPPTPEKPGLEIARFEKDLLFYFRMPQDVAWLERDGRWRKMFGESPLTVVSRLRERGQLVEGSLADHLSAGRSVKELGGLCRAQGLKVSGTREELVLRLIEAVPDTIQALVAGKTVLRCSQATQEVVDRQAADAAEKREAAQSETRDAIRTRDLKLAHKLVEEYDASRPALDMQSGETSLIAFGLHDPEAEAEGLSVLFSRWPRRLTFVPNKDRDAFREAAAYMLLWGLSRPVEETPVPDVAGPLSGDIVVQMLVAFGQTESHLFVFRSDNVETVVLCRDNCCEGCRTGPAIMPLAAAPEIPRPECTSAKGCRCALRPATREERVHVSR